MDKKRFSWIDGFLVILGLFIIYQLIRAILGGSWQTEALIIALVILNLGATWKLGADIMKLNIKFDSHINYHKRKDNSS